MRRALFLLVVLLVTIDASGEESRDPIDRYFSSYWADHAIPHAAPAGQAEFLRRACLDVIGRLPHPGEVREFLGKAGGGDREKKIDELLASDEAATYFADTWLRILLDYRFEEQAPLKMSFPALRDFLMASWKNDTSWKEVATSFISAAGDDAKEPGTNFALAALDPKEPPYELASRTARIFLGIPMQCARCHDHPYEPYKQKAFWGMTAFFAGVHAKARTTFEGYGVKLVDDGPAKLALPGTSEEIDPCFYDGRKPDGRPTRAVLADLVTGDRHFARAIVNRVFAHFMGRGFVEKPDGFSERTAPENELLLDALSASFVENGYSLRWLARTIMSSEAYQLSSETTDGIHPEAHAFMALKPQDPVQLLDTLSETLGLETFLEQRYQDFYGNKAIPEAYRNKAVFRIYLHLFAQSLLAPAGIIPEESRYTGSVRLALKLMNGKDLQNLIRAEQGPLGAIMKLDVPAARVEEIFLTLLSREPTDAERARYLAFVRDHANERGAYEDIYWTLLNSSEFFFNH